MRYVTHAPGRRMPWTEHTGFPVRAIKNWREGNLHWRRSKTVFRVYEVNEDGTEIRFVPEEEWDEHG